MTAPDKRTIEKALRDVGLSRKQAMALLADGYNKAFTERDATDGSFKHIVMYLKEIIQWKLTP